MQAAGQRMGIGEIAPSNMHHLPTCTPQSILARKQLLKTFLATRLLEFLHSIELNNSLPLRPREISEPEAFLRHDGKLLLRKRKTKQLENPPQSALACRIA